MYLNADWSNALNWLHPLLSFMQVNSFNNKEQKIVFNKTGQAIMRLVLPSTVMFKTCFMYKVALIRLGIFLFEGWEPQIFYSYFVMSQLYET